MKKIFYVLGIIPFFCGCGDENRYSDKYEWAREAAKQGDIYYEGSSGVKQSYGMAMLWYQRWSSNDTYVGLPYKAERCKRMGDCFYNGWGCKQSYKRALYWYEKCNNAKGWLGIGRCYYYGHGVSQSYEEAVKWLRKAAEMGEENAQELLGICYFKGHGVKQSYKDAVKWLSTAAKKSSGEAQYYLGICYLKGEGIGQSVSGARTLFETAASKGHVKAMVILGWYYYCDYERYGREQSLVDAVSWFHKAAAVGDAYAQHNLGFCYEYGIGVNQSFVEAKSWYVQAGNRGYDPKNDWLLSEKKKMTDLFEFARKDMVSAQKTYIEIGEALKKQRENLDKLREVLNEFSSTNYQMDVDYQRLVSQCQELKKLQESIVDSIRSTYIAAAKYEASMGEKQEQYLRNQAIENGIREAELATRRFEEMKQNK